MTTQKRDLISEFKAHFAPLLYGSARWDAFLGIAEHLINKNKPLIIGETGTIREPINWWGHGRSALVWDWLIENTGGKGFSVDIDPEVVESAKPYCKNIEVVCSDSLSYLRSSKIIEELDLLYLDSRDYVIGDGSVSMLHHAGELACCWDRLKSGCVIAIDDCHSNVEGKHILVKAFFDIAGIKPVFQSYITVWEKP